MVGSRQIGAASLQKISLLQEVAKGRHQMNQQPSVEELKEWLRQNLLIEVEPVSIYSSGNNVIVSLRIKGDEVCFDRAEIYIP
jgi:hypothetical protein